jgi:hypothetical protein
MLTVGGTEAVLIVVRFLVHLPGVQGAVISLLELDRMSAAIKCKAEQLLTLGQASLVVVSNLGNDIAFRLIINCYVTNLKPSHLPP